MIYLAILFWTVCGVFSYGISLAESQRSYWKMSIKNATYREDVGFSILFGLLGPIGLITSYFLSGFAQHGLKWR